MDIKAFGNVVGDCIAGKDFTGATVSGIDLVVQRFIIALLTEKGSYRFKYDGMDYGCNFVTNIKSGNFYSEIYLSSLFSMALKQIETQLAGIDDKESFGSANLMKIEVASDGVMLHILISNKTGEKKKLLLPLSIIK